jgi:iron complex transport system ATP-binding protein
MDGLAVPILELNNATIVRSGVAVIQGMSLVVGPGEHTAILGPNGSGKSSLLRVLTLEDRPVAATDGSPVLRLFGRERWDVTELRARLGIVTGELDSGFGVGTSGGRVSGLDVTLSGLLGSHGVFAHHEITGAMRQDARGALARVEALHLAGRLLSEMSAGERRRVLIARALITSPDALLLDEPTAGLDLVARHRFMESVRRLAREGTTVILVTHHIDEIIPEIRRVVLLQHGRIACDAAPAVALTSPRLSRVFGGSLEVGQSGGYFHLRHETRLSTTLEEEPMAKYGKSASKNVESAMRRRKKGTLKSSSGQKVKSRKQAIAIGLSEAREKGGKVPARRAAKSTAKSSAKTAAKKGGRKGTKKKAARKK